MVCNMDNIFELKKLLQKKQALFLDVEKITNEMSESPIDKIDELLEKRGEALEQVIELEAQIKAILAEDESLSSVVSCTCDMAALKGEMKDLFEESLRVRAIVNRIIKNEDIVRLRIESERDSLLHKIETLNSSSISVAESYKRSVNTGLPQNFFTSKNKII